MDEWVGGLPVVCTAPWRVNSCERMHALHMDGGTFRPVIRSGQGGGAAEWLPDLCTDIGVSHGSLMVFYKYESN